MGELEYDSAGQGSMSELGRLKRGVPFCRGIRKGILSLIMGIIELVQDNRVNVVYKFLEEVPGEFFNKFIYSLNLQIVVDDTVSNVPGSIDYDSKDFVLDDLCFFTFGKCCDAPNLRHIREDRS
ncbi:hypothetical protein AVEN_55463-1 [Araneus ventricosus]|uniref:Uncharacterized protein n=1 Tax=Araneus ventricosus TaxID=182803 RepID=A0A4Y2IMP6_ARAVE|nr:hypothetical protein AVEN_61158-1 [Araneus ventricosus]GBN60098.1 hypothetical protein AVEN_45273-1 [Araneus ventricosus]GBO40271.1 hypothetical protein AVEN_55463-1 [Araneus ventricosus]